MAEITQELLNEMFEYSDGKLYWKQSTNQKIKIGSEAGSTDAYGYRVIKYKGKAYKAHRVIYMMHYGCMPKYVDHIDGNKLNNCIENLRDATAAQNCQNASTRVDNKSGYKNVNWNPNLHKWVVQLQANGKKHHVGCFDDLELAGLVACEARNTYHKEYSRHE